MNKKQLLNHIKHNVYVRLQPSKYGVGVFAIRDISKGIDPFDSCDNTGHELPFTLKELGKLDVEVFKLIKDFCVLENNKYWIPETGLNSINVAWYLNHSDTPNIKASFHGEEFITNRLIVKGEELTVNYNSYDESDEFFN